MSADIIMLSKTIDELRADWAHNPSAADTLNHYAPLCEPGTRIWVYGYPECFAATVVGLSRDLVESLFGPVDGETARFIEPMLAATRDDTGELFQVGHHVTARREDADRAWHILDAGGLLVAGGPPIYDRDRAAKIAARYGATHTVRQGVPSTGVDRRPDDGLGTHICN